MAAAALASDQRQQLRPCGIPRNSDRDGAAAARR